MASIILLKRHLVKTIFAVIVVTAVLETAVYCHIFLSIGSQKSGILKGPEVLSISKTRSLIECSIKCKSIPRCASFNFGGGGHKCILLSHQLCDNDQWALEDSKKTRYFESVYQQQQINHDSRCQDEGRCLKKCKKELQSPCNTEKACRSIIANSTCYQGYCDCDESHGYYPDVDETTCIHESKLDGEWSPYMSKDTPDRGDGNGDFENITLAKQMYRSCRNKTITAVQCRTTNSALVQYVPHHRTNQNVTCDVSNGLVCRNADNLHMCHNYEIRVFCANTPPKTP